jgi:hypothetical protein
MGTNDRFPRMSPKTNTIGGFPVRMERKLRYIETFTLDPGSANATMVYSLNGLYDPRTGTGGNQPSNFDIWMSVYNKYACHTCDIEVFPLNNGPDQSDQETGVWGFLITQTGSDIGSSTPYRQIAEQPYCKFSEVPPGMKEAPFVSLKARVPVWEFLGLARKNDMLSEQDYAGTASANPSRQTYVEIFYVSPIGNTVGNPAYFSVELTFHTWFFLPRETTASLRKQSGWVDNYVRASLMPADCEKKEEEVLIPPVQGDGVGRESRGWFG